MNNEAKELSKIGKKVDWEFIMHTIAIITRSFKKARIVMEILKKEGILRDKEKEEIKWVYLEEYLEEEK